MSPVTLWQRPSVCMLQQSLTTRWALKYSHFHIHIFTFYVLRPWFLAASQQMKQASLQMLGYKKSRNALMAHVDGEAKKGALNQGSLVVLQIKTIANERGTSKWTLLNTKSLYHILWAALMIFGGARHSLSKLGSALTCTKIIGCAYDFWLRLSKWSKLLCVRLAQKFD